MVIKQIVIIDPTKDPRVIADNERRDLIPAVQRCARCGGTGNEMLFMYRQCQACGGDGLSRGNEAEVKERLGN